MLRTVFGEEIKEGDVIMYIYKSHGDEVICFGTVLKIEYIERKYYPYPSPKAHIHKTYQIQGDRKKICDKKVILTNPTAFKCGQTLNHPFKNNLQFPYKTMGLYVGS